MYDTKSESIKKMQDQVRLICEGGKRLPVFNPERGSCMPGYLVINQGLPRGLSARGLAR